MDDINLSMMRCAYLLIIGRRSLLKTRTGRYNGTALHGGHLPAEVLYRDSGDKNRAG